MRTCDCEFAICKNGLQYTLKTPLVTILIPKWVLPHPLRAVRGSPGLDIQAVLAKKALALATAASWVDVLSRGVDRSESTLLGMGRVTGEVFRVYSKPF